MRNRLRHLIDLLLVGYELYPCSREVAEVSSMDVFILIIM